MEVDLWKYVNTLGGQYPSHVMKKKAKFSVEDEKKARRPISVSTPEDVDVVHDMILSDHPIELKRISEIRKIFY